MIVRALLVALLCAAAGSFASRHTGAEVSVQREALRALPLDLDGWRGADAPRLADDVLTMLGVDDYVNRRYVRGDLPPVGVYVGYYASQRQGDTIHSPENCLPGAGWRPVDAARTMISVGGRSLPVNRFVIQKGLDRQVVLYWYEGRGRLVANEYANKGWLMLDAVRLNRTDGGLVRLMAPVQTSTAVTEDALVSFASALLPRLNRYLP